MHDYDEIVAKLKDVLKDEGRADILNDSERDKLRQMIEAYDLVVSWGRLGKIILWVLVSIASAVIAWEQIAQRVGSQ